MTCRQIASAGVLLALLLSAGCTGGQEGTASEEPRPGKNTVAGQTTASSVDASQKLDQISPVIPLYAGARYRDDLTRRDTVMIRNQYGPGAEVYTLATDDSYPQVYHYYLTYLAQYRAFPSQDPYPPSQKDWRTFEIRLNDVMQDPFIPGETLAPNGRQVILQLVETEAEPRTVIRYIVTPPSAAAPAATVASTPAPEPVTR